MEGKEENSSLPNVTVSGSSGENLSPDFNPFEKVGKSLTSEQITKWKELNEGTCDLVEAPAEDSFTDLSLLASLTVSQSPANTDDEVLAESLISLDAMPSTSKQGEVGEEGKSSFSFLPDEPTLQYLTGKISFQEFSELMEHQESEDIVLEVAPVIEGVTEDVVTIEIESTQVAEEIVEEKISIEESASPRKRRRRKKRADLPKHLEGMMGEANLKFARGDTDEAINMCMEIIRMAPEASLPFQTLGMLYEEQGDLQKSLQFNLIAAYLTPSDASQWPRLAEMSIELNDVTQAIKCYTQAIKSDPKNYSYYFERSKLYEATGELKKALDGYKAMLKLVPKEDGEQNMELARNITKTYFEQDDKASALETMKNAFISCPGAVTSEDVNLLLELQMSQKEYFPSLEVLVKHCGVSFELESGEKWGSKTVKEAAEKNQTVDISSVKISDLLPIDLRVKLAICLIHMKSIKMSKAVLQVLLQENVEEVGDLFLDTAEAYMEENLFIEAKPILQQLVASKNFNVAAVWLQFAECLDRLGEIEQAVEAYGKVVELAPSHIGARMSLSTLQQQLGKHEEALQALNRDDSGSALLSKQEQSLLLHKCLLLHSQGKYDEFQSSCTQLLFYQFTDIKDHDLRKIAYNYRSVKHKLEGLLNHIKPGIKDPCKSDLPVDDLWDLFVKLSEILLSRQKYTDLMESTAFAMSCPYFMTDQRKLKQAEFMCILACLLTKKEDIAFRFVRELCLKEGHKNQVWNLLNQVLLVSTEKRHDKFCLRYLLRHPDHVPIGLLNGHNAAISGTYMYALGEYVSVFRNCPDDPLVSLCIGLTFVHLAGQKFASKKHILLTQGLAFLNNYLQLRGECQEPYYNIGRALHQLGLTYAAVHYYKKVLSLPPMVEDSEGRYDLRREAAYNLTLIYQASGSTELARQIIHQHLIV